MKNFNPQSKYRHLFSAIAISCSIVLVSTGINASAQKYKPVEKKIKLPPANPSLQDAQPAQTTPAPQAPINMSGLVTMPIGDLRHYPSNNRPYIHTEYKCPTYKMNIANDSREEGWDLSFTSIGHMPATELKVEPPQNSRSGNPGYLRCIYASQAKHLNSKRAYPQNETCIVDDNKKFICRKQGPFIEYTGNTSLAPSETADISSASRSSNHKIPTIWWRAISARAQTLKAADRAMLVRVRTTPSPSLCERKLANGGRPPGYQVGFLRAGMQFCYKSRRGHYGTFKITSLSSERPKTLNIEFTTWLKGEEGYH